MRKIKLKTGLLLVVGLVAWGGVSAQHTFGVTAGYGMANGRFEPKLEKRAQWGMYSSGVSWRYYGQQRFVGGFGIDLEFIQQGFSIAQNSSQVENPEEFIYYTRRINSLMLPIVWQPHFYLFRNHVRFYLEAAATFSYNLSSTYENEMAHQAGKPDWKGDYRFKLARDNRWGYGLAGGAGLAFLIKRIELNVRVRYYFGYSDLLRNRTKYANNADDGPENPFSATPQRSPLDNINISFGVSYRFNKEGFNSWKPRPKREKNKEVFKYTF